ncbi:hypothetical protein EYF80_021599 [Liparis tanakae]|uniref:Uncharacterized protein n=1 Tax=Liparis tanakae TaxID=230148 RepID=A0A4Z2HQJ6_9TELE|nr:hypothetical protein EYF80_021599 [Liparis tanakae]
MRGGSSRGRERNEVPESGMCHGFKDDCACTGMSPPRQLARRLASASLIKQEAGPHSPSTARSLKVGRTSTRRSGAAI